MGGTRADQNGEIPGLRALGHLNKYFLKYKWRFFLGILFIIGSNIFDVYRPQVIRDAFDQLNGMIDQVTGDGVTQGEREMIFSEGVKYAGLFLLFSLVKGFFLFLTRQTLIVMSRYMEYDLKNEVYAHYQELDAAFYKRNNTGDLMNRITEDVTRVRMYLGPAVMYTLNLIVLFVLVISVMFSVNKELSLYVLLPLPVLSVTIYYISSILNWKGEMVQRQLSRISTFVQESFSGIHVLKIFNRGEAYREAFNEESEEYKERSMSLARTNAFFFPTVLLLIGLSTILTIYIGGMKAIEGEISLGNIAEFVFYVNMLTWPFTSVGWVTSLVQRAAASQKRINEFLRTRPEVVSPKKGVKKPIEGGIEFRDVSFVYHDSGIRALDHVSFRVEPGEVLGVIGRTGSGKTTLGQLITREFDPTEGEVRIDGRDIRSYDLNTLREYMGYVPQEVFLFSDTIANNIAFGVDSVTADSIEQVARDADVYDNIVAFRDKFETMLGERGVTLSGGQKQRVSIARALLRSPRILIFDDCLSAVDTETEERILRNLRSYMQGRTSVIISHRVSSVMQAHKVLVLEKGRVIESGDHQTLLQKEGIYAEMYRKQLLEGKAES